MFTLIFTLIAVLLLITGGVLTFVGRDKDGDFETRFRPLSGIPFAVAAVLLFSIGLGFTSVDAGNVGVVKRFGNPVRQLQPGIHFVLPYADDVTPVTVQTRIVNPSEDAASRDLQIVHTEVTLAFHVDPAYATYILTELNNDEATRVIVPAIQESIKAVTAQYDVQQLVANRPLVRDGIESLVKEKIAPYHIVAETVSITDFSFSKDFEDAIEAKVTAQQNAEQEKNTLVAVQVRAQQQIAQAQGEAEALKVQKEQITPELLKLRTIEMMKEKWNGVLPTTIVGGSSALPMMDVLTAARAEEGKK
jgi:regulator of protease activity HflC (stomatin/prohibitin superfamily)